MKKTTFSLLAASSLFLASLPNLAFAENQTDIDITINQSLTLTLGKTALELQAGPDLNTDYMTITGSTNSQAGFAISFNVNNPYNDLKHENATIRESIPSLTEDKTAAEFPETAWGYTLETENQTFKKIPLTSENIFSTEENGQGTYNFGLGVKVAANQAAGRYENELIFTIVANPLPPTSLSHIKNMQQMTPEICKNSVENETKQLKDVRDGKTYWVTKLADENCWMTQNLDLDLDKNVALTPEDSDVAYAWAPTESTFKSIEDVKNGWGGDWWGSNYSFDPGDYYVEGVVFTNNDCDYIATTCEHYSTTPYEINGEHGHVGNYYNWATAAATSDIKSIGWNGENTVSSICPKGWRLPYGSHDGRTYESYNVPVQEGEQNPLLQIYAGATTGRYGEISTSSVSQLVSAPLFHIYNTGYINSYGYVENKLDWYTSGYWSSTLQAGTEGSAAILRSISDGRVSASYFDNRSHGFNVRCVAHKEDLGAISTMQEMTPEVVENTALHTSKQLTDTRDGKSYWVTKLADGNIWMTQNLDYDLSVTSNQTLTPATSNVTENRTVVPANTDLATFADDNNSIYYLDGGDIYYANGTTKTEGLSTLPEDDTNRHYAQGDYYSWKAATAGVGTASITNADVNESICPSGWRLPTSNSDSANYSFGNLVKQYGYTGSNQSGTTDATLLASPLFFARGGGVFGVFSGSLDYQGSYGVYWSSRAYSGSLRAYDLYFNSSDVFPSDDSRRFYGFSVRCVAL